jgi:hypothetical protein
LSKSAVETVMCANGEPPFGSFQMPFSRTLVFLPLGNWRLTRDPSRRWWSSTYFLLAKKPSRPSCPGTALLPFVHSIATPRFRFGCTAVRSLLPPR